MIISLSTFKKFLFPFLLIIGTGISLQGAEIQAGSKIKEVTVYLQGARVYRSGSAAITPGTNTIVFSGLSDQIDEKSIEILSGGAFQVLSVNYGINELKTLQKPESLRKLNASYDSAVLRVEFTKNEKQALESQLEALKANQQLGINEKTLYAEDVDEWLEAFKRKSLDIRNKLTKINLVITEAEDNTDKIKRQLDRLDGNRKAPSGEIKVTVLSTKYDNADFRFNYYVPAARWEPAYNLRANKLNDPINMDYDARIYQTTGEEWKEVKLTLSTGNPTLGGNRPKISSWFLEYYDEEDYSKGYNKDISLKGGRANAATMMVSGLKKKEEFEAQKPVQVTVSQGHTSTNFEISLRYSVMPDGEPQQVRIQQSQLPATFNYVAVPKYDKDAFLEAKISGWEQYNLLSGYANIFLEGMYVGKSFIDPIATGDTFSISFGRDRKIDLERERIQTEGASAKIFSGSNKKEYFSYEITVKNLKPSVADLTLEDQIPRSQVKDIEVEVKDKDLSGADYDKETGKLTWKLKMLPSETKKLKFSYIIVYPKNKVISNLY